MEPTRILTRKEAPAENLAYQSMGSQLR